MIISDIETTEKVEYEDLLKNYYEKMEIIEEQDKEIKSLNNIINNDDVYGYIKHLEDLIAKKDNIINEVKKYIIQEMNNINPITYINILEILDKVGDEK